MRHTAATVIAQRFWYAKVRWITRSRMGRIVMHRYGLDYSRLKEAPMSMDQFMKLIVFSQMPNALAKWVQSIICTCRRETDELGGDMRRLMTDNPGNSINRVLSAFLFALYGRSALDVSLPYADDLYQSSVQLCLLIHECMKHTTSVNQDSPICLRTIGRRVVKALSSFLEIHQEWLATNSQIIFQRLAAGAIARMHELIGTHGAPQSLPLGSFAVRSMAVTGETEPIRQILFDSSAVRMMRKMAHSELWGSHGMCTMRFAHELMMDPGYKVTMELTIPLLSNKYAPHRRVWSADELIFDVGTVIMWECHRAEDISELAETVDLDQFPERLHNIPDTVERIRSVIMRLMPAEAYESDTLTRGGLPPVRLMGAREALQLLLHSTLTLRNSLANAQVDELRELSGARSATPDDFLLNVHHAFRDANPLTIASSNTRRWVQEAVLRCIRDKTLTVGKLAHGDPFALLKFHDHAIIDTVVGPIDGTVCTSTSTAYAIPDILYFDLGRIHRIRQTLHTHYRLHGRRQHSSSTFRELVTSGECLSHTPPAEEIGAADALRMVVHICRYKHGNMIAHLAQNVAQDIERASDPTAALIAVARPLAD
jgi:hypothetical protein